MIWYELKDLGNQSTFMPQIYFTIADFQTIGKVPVLSDNSFSPNLSPAWRCLGGDGFHGRFAITASYKIFLNDLVEVSIWILLL